MRVVFAIVLASLALTSPGHAAGEAENTKAYREAAWAHFRKRCAEDAGEKIYRKVEGVAGLLLLRPREQATDAQLRDQYWRGDPYGHDSALPDSEIRNFIGYLNDQKVATRRVTARPGYQYVETKDPAGGYRRFRLGMKGHKFQVVSVIAPTSRYGVTWDDISTQKDRSFWVAGGRLQVLELATKEVLGERIAYIIEPGFGSKAGGRVPWGHARLVSSDRAACPPFRPQSLVPVNRLFVVKVLVPAWRESNGG